MLKKVLVMEIKGTYAVVMEQGGALIRVRRKDGMRVGDRLYVLPEDILEEQAIHHAQPDQLYGKKRKQQKYIKSVAGIAAVIALVVATVLFGTVPKVYAVASFDSERELQLEVDKRYRIIGGSSSGDQITQNEMQNLKGKYLMDVGGDLSRLLGDGPVLIGFAPCKENTDSDDWVEQVLRQMFPERVLLYLSGNGEDITGAESDQTSLGRYLAGEVVEGEQLDQLKDFIEACQERDDDDDDDDDDDTTSDISYLEELELDQIMAEIQKNPGYQDQEDVLEIVADKVEELHDEHKEQEEKDDEDTGHESDSDEENDRDHESQEDADDTDEEEKDDEEDSD